MVVSQKASTAIPSPQQWRKIALLRHVSISIHPLPPLVANSKIALLAWLNQNPSQVGVIWRSEYEYGDLVI